MKGKKKRDATGLPELPEARPLPQEANPGGTEGVDAAWPGGSSNLGEVINPRAGGRHDLLDEGPTARRAARRVRRRIRVRQVRSGVCHRGAAERASEDGASPSRVITPRRVRPR